jgi:hypothetical protein
MKNRHITLKSLVLTALCAAPFAVCAEEILTAPTTSFSTAKMEELLQQIADNSSGDMSRKELAQALINYEASARLQEYNLQEEKMFMMAPGSEMAIDAGIKAGTVAPQVSSNVKTITSSVVSKSISGSGGGAAPVDAMTPFLKSGDADSLDFGINAILQKDRINSLEEAQTAINALTVTDGIPVKVEKTDSGDIDWVKTDRDAVRKKFNEQVNVMVATNALAELAAKRVAADSNSPSLAEILRDQSRKRFSDKDWYQNVGVSSTEALLREMVHMQAFQLEMNYQDHRMQEQIVSLLAAMLTTQNKFAVLLDELQQAVIEGSAAAEAASKDIKSEDLEKMAEEAEKNAQ